MTRLRYVAERVIYQNAENGYSMMKVRVRGCVNGPQKAPDGQSPRANGNMGHVDVSVLYNLN